MKKTPCPKHATKIAALAYNPEEGAQNHYFCGRGLYIDVRPTGRKIWRLKYRVGGKATIHTIGEFPELSLKDAEDRRTEVLKLAREGKKKRLIDKAEAEKNIREQTQIFKNIVAEWRLSETYPRSRSSQKSTARHLKRFILPAIENMPVSMVTDDHIETILKECKRSYPEISDETKRCLIDLKKVFNYAISKKLITENPCRRFFGKNPLTKKVSSGRNQPGIIEPKEFGEMLRKIDDYGRQRREDFSELTVLFIRALAYVACRTCELWAATWKDLSVSRKELTIYLSKTKKHVTFALSDQAITIFQKIRSSFGDSAEGAIFNPLAWKTPRPVIWSWRIFNKLGYKGIHTPHGFRRSFKTMGEKYLEFRIPAVEEQLTHELHAGERVRGAYDGQSYLEERKIMMQVWADFIDSLEAGKKPDMAVLRNRYKEQSAPDFEM